MTNKMTPRKWYDVAELSEKLYDNETQEQFDEETYGDDDIDCEINDDCEDDIDSNNDFDFDFDYITETNCSLCGSPVDDSGSCMSCGYRSK